MINKRLVDIYGQLIISMPIGCIRSSPFRWVDAKYCGSGPQHTHEGLNCGSLGEVDLSRLREKRNSEIS